MPYSPFRHKNFMIISTLQTKAKTQLWKEVNWHITKRTTKTTTLWDEMERNGTKLSAHMSYSL